MPVPSGAGGGGGGAGAMPAGQPPPADREEKMVEKLRGIFPQLPAAKLRSTLKEHQWDLAQASNALTARGQGKKQDKGGSSQWNTAGRKEYRGPSAKSEADGRSPPRGDPDRFLAGHRRDRSRGGVRRDPNHQAPDRDPDEVTVEIDVPVEKYGLLVGPGGTTVRERLMQPFNVKMRIPKREEGGCVAIIGKRADCVSALEECGKIIGQEVRQIEPGRRAAPAAAAAAAAAGAAKNRSTAMPNGGRVVQKIAYKGQSAAAVPGQQARSWLGVVGGPVAGEAGVEEQVKYVKEKSESQKAKPASPARGGRSPRAAAKLPERREDWGDAHAAAGEWDQRNGGTSTCGVNPGDRVRLREREDEHWAHGVVTKVEDGKPIVQADGWLVAYQPKFVERVDGDGAGSPTRSHAGKKASPRAAPAPMPPPSPPRTGPPELKLAPGEEPTDDKKVRGAYAALDADRTGAVGVEQWTACFARLALAFDPEDRAAALFRKADKSGAGRVSFADFERFVARYPMLLDAIFFRAVDAANDPQRRKIEEASRSLDNLRDRQQQAHSSAAKSAALVTAQAQLVSEARQGLDAAQQKEQGAQRTLQEAGLEVERTRNSVTACQEETRVAEQEETRARNAVVESQRHVDQSKVKMKAQQKEQQIAADRLAELERLVQEQRQKVERLRVLSDEAAGVVQSAGDHAAQAAQHLTRSQENSRATAGRLDATRRALDAAVGRERDVDGELASLRDDTAEQLARRDAEERRLVQHQDDERQRREEESSATQLAEEAAKWLHKLEDDDREREEERRRDNDEENESLSKEARIRFQRDELEAEEEELRSLRRPRGTRAGA